MILDIDIGNSRTKWRLLAKGEQASHRQGVVNGRDLAQLSEALGCELDIERIRIASVAGAGFEQQINHWALASFDIEPEYARVTSECAGVSNAYGQPQRMGVDRWLAMLAAFQQLKSACYVVGCGSAITVDRITQEGRHEGGYIVPGLMMQASALLNSTDKVKITLAQRFEANGVGFANNTQDAVMKGILAMAVGGIMQLRTHRDDPLILSGGDAVLIGAHLSGRLASKSADKLVDKSSGKSSGKLSGNITLEPELVMRGLAIALP